MSSRSAWVKRSARVGTRTRGGLCRPLVRSTAGVVLDHAGKPTSCIGLYLEQIYRTRLGRHLPVSIDSAGIIGPSAGLAFTLGLLEKLDPADLTGGKRIAATGTMAINGAVGDVGGVAQKTVAVRDAGAVLFLVPLPGARGRQGARRAASEGGSSVDHRAGNIGPRAHRWPPCHALREELTRSRASARTTARRGPGPLRPFRQLQGQRNEQGR